MKFYFFLSYASGNNDEDEVDKFFDALSAELRRREGLKETGPEVGFRDKGELKTGADWQRELMAALQDSRTLICLYSPAYFNSDWCGREWRVFRLRQEFYVQLRRQAGEVDPVPPRTIKPVRWMPSLMPEAAAMIQAFDFDTNDDLYRKEGLFRLIRWSEDHKIEYEKFIAALAQDILDEKDIELPAYPFPENHLLKQVKNPFSESDSPPVTTGGEVVVPQPNPVRRYIIYFLSLSAIASVLSVWFLVGKRTVEWIEKLIGSSKVQPENPGPPLDSKVANDRCEGEINQWEPEDIGWGIERVREMKGRHIRGDKVGLFKTWETKNPFCLYQNFTLDFTVRFVTGKGVAWIVRAQDFKNYYLFELCTSKSHKGQKKFNIYVCENGNLVQQGPGENVSIDIDQDFASFAIRTVAEGSKFTHSIKAIGSDDPTYRGLGEFDDGRFPRGGIGFRPMNDMDVLLQKLIVQPTLLK